MLRSRTVLLLAAAIALPIAAPGAPGSAWRLDRELKKIERRLSGADEQIRAGCRDALVRIDDRPPERERSLELRRSDVRLRGAGTGALRACARAVAGAGVVESWRVTQGSGGDFTLTMVLLRARRDPQVTGGRRREKTDREAARALAAIWEDRREAFEALAPEVLAPDLVVLDEARWNAGNLSFTGRAADDRLADGYRRLVRAAVASTSARIEWAVTAEAPPAAMPALPEDGMLRGVFHDAPAGSVLRLFAEMDRRDFVLPSSSITRSGGLAGGWSGILHAIAKELARQPLHAGQVDVLAPPGSAPPPRRTWDGRRVTLDLEAVPSAALWTLLSVAGKAAVEGPADLPATDLHVKNVPWDQVVDAVALSHGCGSVAEDANRRRVVCGEAAPTATPAPAAPGDAAPDADERPPLTRFPASALRIAALGVRGTGKSWRAIVRTPPGLHVLVRTGTPLGVDGGLAVVDEHGVSVVLERARPDGTAVFTAIPLSFSR